jgi:hypothetical protein
MRGEGCWLKPRLKTADFCSLGRMGDDKAAALEAAGGLISISRGARSRRSGLNPLMVRIGAGF